MADSDTEERTDIDSGKLLITGVAVAGVLLVVLAGIYGLYAWFDRNAGAPMPGARLATRPAQLTPHLQSQPGSDLLELRARKRAVLESYGWVDRDAGIARIPIERAMRLLLERHGKAGEGGR